MKVEEVDVDRYGRTVGIVHIGNLILNRHLIEYGYAWVYSRYCLKPFCVEWKQVEKKARSEKRGLWRNPKVIPPWEYRRSGKR